MIVNLKDTFNNVVTMYDAARPTYPLELPEESLGFDKEGIEGVRQKRISQIQSGNYFGIPVIKEYRWIDTYDADRYSLLLESYSSTQTLDEEHKKLYLSEVRDYINSNGGVVEMPQHVMLYLVKKE